MSEQEQIDGYSVDRDTWGSGPWDSEPQDRIEWRFAEDETLVCLMLRNGQGAWCGYVGLPPKHSQHGEDYYSADIGEASPHGGLTYAAECAGHVCHVPKEGEPEVWWLGFDCTHYCDAVPSLDGQYGSGTYRDIDFVKKEVNELAAALAEVG